MADTITRTLGCQQFFARVPLQPTCLWDLWRRLTAAANRFVYQWCKQCTTFVRCLVEDQAKPHFRDTSTSVSTIVDADTKGRVACGVRTTHGGVKQRYPALQHQRGSQQLSRKRRRQSRPPIQPRQQTSLLTHRQSRQRTVKVQQLRNIGRVGVCGCGMEEKKCVCVSVLFCLNFKKGGGRGENPTKKTHTTYRWVQPNSN